MPNHCLPQLLRYLLPVLLLVPFGPARATGEHPGQSVDLRISISDEEVAMRTLISADLAQILLAQSGVTARPRATAEGEFRIQSETERAQAAEAIDGWFRERNTVEVDGVEISPILAAWAFEPAQTFGLPLDPNSLPPDLRVVTRYPVLGEPKQVRIVWGIYPEDPSREMFGLSRFAEVTAQLDAYDENKLVVFMQEEPELVWHAPLHPPQERVLPVVAEVEPERWRIPVVSIAILAVYGLALSVVRFTPAWRRVGRTLLLVGIVPVGTAAATLGVGNVAVASPFAPALELPDRSRATEIFESLHRNIYRAFEYKKESDIYDVLANSVGGELLDKVYNEVYQSLILRDQGGAVARIKNVELLNSDVRKTGVVEGSQTVGFRMLADWRVEGAVYHWGHVHTRTNQYQALYTVAQREGKWKITGAEVLQQRRIVGEDDDPLPIPLRDPEDGPS